MQDSSERPLAEPTREQSAKELFPYLRMSPEEYAARKGLFWLLFSFDEVKYRDTALDEWIQRLAQILPNSQLIEELMQQYLTPQEIAEIKREYEEMCQRELED